MLRRIIVSIVLLAAALLGPAGVAKAHHAPKACPQHWWRGPWHVKQLIKCASSRSDVSRETALRVARCESGFRPALYSTGNAGVFQHATRYWSDRAAAYGFGGWSVYNTRANVFVTVRMVRAGGWSPWSCY
jgi:hypothetical protein